MKGTWYLWPINNNPRTNEYLAQMIEQYPEHEHRDKLCSDGAKRNLYATRDGYKSVQTAIDAISKYNLKFEVFQETSGGMIVQFNFWKREVRQAARRARHKKMIHRAS